MNEKQCFEILQELDLEASPVAGGGYQVQDYHQRDKRIFCPELAHLERRTLESVRYTASIARRAKALGVL